MWAKSVFVVRKREISRSGLVPASTFRKFFRIKASPKMMEVLLCSARLRVTVDASGWMNA